MEGDQSHRAWKWALAVISLILLISSLFLIAQGPEISISEERVPVTTTTHVTRQVPRSQILSSGTDLLIPAWGCRYSGPYRLGVGKTLKILRAMYERGEIEGDVYRKLESEISEEKSSMKDIIN